MAKNPFEVGDVVEFAHDGAADLGIHALTRVRADTVVAYVSENHIGFASDGEACWYWYRFQHAWKPDLLFEAIYNALEEKWGLIEP